MEIERYCTISVLLTFPQTSGPILTYFNQVLFICSSREQMKEPSDLPNPLEWTTMTTAGWAAASASVAAVGDLGA